MTYETTLGFCYGVGTMTAVFLLCCCFAFGWLHI